MAATLDLPASAPLAELSAGRIPAGRLLTKAQLRTAYATAACLYKVMPAAVAYPTDAENFRELLKQATARNLAGTARGGGSGLVGNALGRGVIFDCRGAMRKLIRIDETAKTVTVEPGIFLGELNKELEKRRLWFPVEPSSGDYATVGGLVANNAGGARSVKYGSVVHQLRAVEGLFADGTPFQWDLITGLKTSAYWKKRIKALAAILRAELPKLQLPQVAKISTGYRLESLGEFSEMQLGGLLPLLAGSEGTLALFTSITLRVVKKPAARRTALLVLDSLAAAARAVPPLLVHRPAAIELLDETAIRLALQFDAGLARHFRGDEVAALLVECEGDSGFTAGDALRDAVAELATAGISARADLALDAEKSEALWNLRKITSPLVHAGHGHKKGLRFIEDGVVASAKVPDFIRGVKSLCKKQQTTAVFFGHIGSGNIHINPFLDPRSRADRKRMQFIYDGFSDLVESLGGSLSGEHGDGRLRTAAWTDRNPKLTAVYREIKTAFDPGNRLNPGIKVPPSEEALARMKYRKTRK